MKNHLATSAILIIGSNSFSGSSFVDFLLKKKLFVIGISRRKEISPVFLRYFNNKNKKKFFKFYKCDLNKDIFIFKKIIKKFKPSIIINFSSQGMVEQSWKNPIDWYRTNILAQTSMIDVLKNDPSIKIFIQFTTPEVYGSIPNKTKEKFSFKPTTPYAISRAAFDLHLLNLFKFFKFPVIFTRAANVYGEHQQLFRVIPRSLISKVTSLKINLDGGGSSIRSFIHIDDVSEALYKIILSGKVGDTYHISTNKFISISSLVKKILNNKNELISVSPERIGKDMSYKLNSNKIRQKLLWKDKISLDQGIKRTFNWIKNNKKLLSRFSKVYKHIK
jgi:dTDP-glucose 4,6-dehydratase